MTLVKSDSYYMDALIGWRRIGMDFQMSEDGEGGIIDSDLSFNDAFVAINGRYTFGEAQQWSIDYYADIGAGDPIGPGRHHWALPMNSVGANCSATIADLDYDFGDAKDFDDLTMTFSGPSIGARFEF